MATLENIHCLRHGVQHTRCSDTVAVAKCAKLHQLLLALFEQATQAHRGAFLRGGFGLGAGFCYMRIGFFSDRVRALADYGLYLLLLLVQQWRAVFGNVDRDHASGPHRAAHIHWHRVYHRPVNQPASRQGLG